VPTPAVGTPEVIRPGLKRPTEAQRVAAASGNTNTTEARPQHASASTPAATTTTKVTTEKTPEKTATAFSNNYTTKQGDTFWKIAQSHKTTPEAIMKANNIKDAKKLKPGMTLHVP
jgi:LysM repeat protein